MSILQLALLAIGLMTVVALAYFALVGPSPAKEGSRRLQSVRFRHSESTIDKVESQMKKAIAARRPKMHKIAGSSSRAEALQVRLMRSGKNWSISQYLYTSLGIALGIAVLIYLRTGAFLLALGIGVVIGAGLPHMALNFFIKRRTNGFNSKFPDAIELLVRGLRSGLPVTETLSVVAAEIPGPVGQEFKAIVDRIHARDGDGAHELERIEFFGTVHRRALDLRQHVDRHAFRRRFHVGELGDEAGTLVA